MRTANLTLAIPVFEHIAEGERAHLAATDPDLYAAVLRDYERRASRDGGKPIAALSSRLADVPNYGPMSNMDREELAKRDPETFNASRDRWIQEGSPGASYKSAIAATPFTGPQRPTRTPLSSIPADQPGRAALFANMSNPERASLFRSNAGAFVACRTAWIEEGKARPSK